MLYTRTNDQSILLAPSALYLNVIKKKVWRNTRLKRSKWAGEGWVGVRKRLSLNPGLQIRLPCESLFSTIV